MANIFESATLKLTSWYLVIIMVISIAFSAAIYQFAMGEFSAKLEVAESEIQQGVRLDLPQNFFLRLHLDQHKAASDSLLTGLFYVNLIILFGGGVGSYALARRTLRPIEEANISQTRFIADASHQLRTPLAIMKAELETALRGDNLSPTETTKLLKSTVEEVDKLSTLSHRLLEMSQLYDQPPDNKREMLSYNKLLKGVVNNRNKTEKRIKLKTPRRLYINANPSQIEDLIDILLDNALKYSPAKSTVEVSLRKFRSQAILKVSNSGSHIPAEDLSKIFERFYRANPSKISSGYGLGLAIAKKIVETHGGQIKASSKKGGLTTFTVTLKTVK